jgi:RNA polymerase sigma-70 factor (ECF subfamily)
MQAAIAGDGDAYRRLLDKLLPLVTAIAHTCLARNGRDRSDLDDVVQEALLAIHLKRHLWNPSRPLVPWIRALVVNKAIDVLRRKGHRLSVPIGDYENVLAAPTSEPDLNVDGIATLIGSLKGRQRDVLEAVALKSMSVPEAASFLGISEGNARVTLHRGLKALADLYRKAHV